MDGADDDDSRVMELLAAIADGKAFDPDAESVRSLPPEVLDSLRVLAEISGVPIDTSRHVDSTTSSPTPDTAPALNEPANWRHLSLREQVGAGHFGTVYRAWDTVLERHVALKLLHS